MLELIQEKIKVNLTKMQDAVRRIDEKYNLNLLESEGINVHELLGRMTEDQLMEYLEQQGIEESISLDEIEHLAIQEEYSLLLDVPYVKKAFFSLKNVEEDSPFNSVDYLRNNEVDSYNPYKYFLDKAAQRAKELAIMHSCVSNPEDKDVVKQRYISFVTQAFKSYADWLRANIPLEPNQEKRSRMTKKLLELNSNIRRLRTIWHKHAYD